MSDLLITENAFAALRDVQTVPQILELEDCDLLTHGPPRDLAGVVELSIAGGRVTADGLQRWLAACPDLAELDVEGADLGELSWKALPARLQRLFVRGGKLGRLVDPPATSGLSVIELSSCGLEAIELSPSLGSLEKLSLAYNPALGVCPDLPWSAAPFRLDLRGCGLSCWPSVPGVEKVSALDLSFNPIPTVTRAVKSWSSLGSLRLQQCPLARLDEALGALPFLRELWLTNSGLAQLPTSLWELPNLRVLDLTRCQLTELPECIGDAAALETLLLSENPMPRVPEAILGLGKLRNLNLWKTGLVGLPSPLVGLDELRQLELSYNPLKHLPDLSGLPALGSLGLCGLRELDWREAFDRLAQLQCVGNISFTNNDFEAFDRRVFNIPGLSRVDVNKTKVDDAEWPPLREAFPEVTIWSG